MTLLEEIRAGAVRKGPACTVRVLLDGLAPDDRADLLAAFQDQSIPSSIIGTVLRERKHTITDETLQRHRRDACRCKRP